MAVEESLSKSLKFWLERLSRMGDTYVGRVGESHVEQKKRIESILGGVLSGTYYSEMVDYGCGWGRLIPELAKYAGHIWAVDVLEGVLDRAEQASPIVSAIKLKDNAELPLPSEFINCFVAVSVFHYLKDDILFKACADDICRVLKSGARVVIIDNAVDKDYHVKPRTDAEFAEALSLRPGWHASRVTINKRANDHWLIDGIKA